MTISELNEILSKGMKQDKRRVAWLSKLVQALCVGKTTNLSKLSRVVEDEGKVASRYRRTQRFFAEFCFEMSDCAAIVMNLFEFGEEKPYLLMDRTEWEYGKRWINILMVAVAYKRCAIPLGWVILPGRGNSSIQARAFVLEAIFKRFGAGRFAGLLADREFIGQAWFARLQSWGMPFYIRVKDNADTTNSRGQSVEAAWLFHHLRPGEQEGLATKRRIYGHDLTVWGAKSPTDGKPMIVVSNQDNANNIEEYLKRWDIETLFGHLKSRGFDFEATHMVDHDKISRLIFVLTLAYIWALKVGLFLQQRVKVIPLKKHGRPLYSLFRAGLDFLGEALLKGSIKAMRLALKALLCKRPPPLRHHQIILLRRFVVY